MPQTSFSLLSKRGISKTTSELFSEKVSVVIKMFCFKNLWRLLNCPCSSLPSPPPSSCHYLRLTQAVDTYDLTYDPPTAHSSRRNLFVDLVNVVSHRELRAPSFAVRIPWQARPRSHCCTTIPTLPRDKACYKL